MSIDSIVSLQTYYPFTSPSEDAMQKAVQQLVLDARLYVTLPASFTEPPQIGEWLTAELTGVETTATDANFTFTIECQSLSQPITIELSGVDYRDPVPAGSFVLINKDLLSAGMSLPISGLPLHPSCLVIWQETPVIQLRTTTSMASDGSRATSVVSLTDGAKFRSGYNVSAGVRNGTLYFRGYAGGGIGRYSLSPWSDISELYPKRARGLRSINGLYGDVVITGSRTAAVTVSAAPDATISIGITGEERG